MQRSTSTCVVSPIKFRPDPAWIVSRLTHFFLSLVLVCVAKGSNAQTTTDLELSGVIGSGQVTRYVSVPFRVPAGTARISISLSYSGRADKSTIDLGVEDPERFRGWSGGNKSEFTISSTDATPSYLPGPLPAGEWKLILGVAYIRAGNSVNYTAKVRLTPDGDTAPDSFTTAPLVSGARWYRGDLHVHTAHSDGSCASQSGKSAPCPIFVSVQEAAHRGLDFLAITDHNTTSHYDEERELQPYFDQLLLIPGRELTTYAGHANIWGITRFVDFRAGGKNPASRNAMLAEARALGAVTSVNHPIGPEAERCIGCRWDAADADPSTDMRQVSAIEVINGPSTSPGAYFQQGDIRFWEAQLALGFHITAVGGSDTHRPDVDTIGLPTTVVFAPELSVKAILDGIRAGHVYLDLTGSRDLPRKHPRSIELEARSGAVRAMMGETLLPAAGSPIELTTRVRSSAGSEVRFVLDGSPDAEFPAVTVRDDEQTFTHTWLPRLAPGKPHWIRVEVRGADGSLQLFSNPIYLSSAVR